MLNKLHILEVHEPLLVIPVMLSIFFSLKQKICVRILIHVKLIRLVENEYIKLTHHRAIHNSGNTIIIL